MSDARERSCLDEFREKVRRQVERLNRSHVDEPAKVSLRRTVCKLVNSDPAATGAASSNKFRQAHVFLKNDRAAFEHFMQTGEHIQTTASENFRIQPGTGVQLCKLS